MKSRMFDIFRVKVKCHSQQVLFLLIKKKSPSLYESKESVYERLEF